MTSLYIHIPFCESKCYYCDFCSGVYKSETVQQYVAALIDEVKQSRIPDEIETVFIGGGTPSSIDSAHIGKIMDAVYSNYNLSARAEISIECNPNSATAQKLLDYKSMGINRVSLGVQTTSDTLLRAIGRLHTSKDFERAAEHISQNFTNYNFDLMLGLPNQTARDVETTLRDVLKFAPPHVSAYSLILEEGTPLYKMVSQNILSLPSEDETIALYDLTCQTLQANGLPRYEISNFAKPNHECAHNLNYWACGEYLGFGLSAHSYKNGVRYASTPLMKNYLSGTHRAFEEKLTPLEQQEEMIMLSLRLERGLNLKTFEQKFARNLLVDKQREIEILQSENLIIIENDVLKIAPNAFYVSNAIISRLI